MNKFFNLVNLELLMNRNQILLAVTIFFIQRRIIFLKLSPPLLMLLTQKSIMSDSKRGLAIFEADFLNYPDMSRVSLGIH